MTKKGQVRAEITVYGDVQGVGYRYFVRRVAWKLGLKGNIENMEDGTVRIVCEGAKKGINLFVESIDVKRPPISVEKVSSNLSDATGEFAGFKILPGSLEEEMIEGFSTGAAYFEVMFDKQDQALGKMDLMLDKQDLHIDLTEQGLEKQDLHIGLTKQGREKQDLHIGLTKQGLEKQDEHTRITKRGFEDLSSKLDGYAQLKEEISELREEFTKMKEALESAGILG